MKPLDAKVEIHKLATRFREISDIPYKTTDETDEENEIKDKIQQIVSSIRFKNEIDQADFKEYVKEQLGGLEVNMPEPEGEKIYDESLTAELRPKREETKSIIPIAEQRQKKEKVAEEINKLQKEKEFHNLVAKKDKLAQEVESMRDKQAEAQKEASFLTEKKDKDGIAKLRTEKYNKKMDNYNMDKIILEQELAKKDPEKDMEEIKTIQESIKITDKKIRQLQMVKVTNYIQQAMVKIPRWINKGTSAIGELTQGIGKGFSGMGFEDSGGKQRNDFGFNEDSMFGGNEKRKKRKDDDEEPRNDMMDFGFNEDSMFGSNGEREVEEKPKKKKKKRKKSKKKKN